VWLGEREYVYDPEHLLVLSVPMPFECQTTASEEEPLLGLAIGVDPILVGELLLEMGDAANAEPSSYVSSTAVNEEVMDASVRLAEALASRSAGRILGPQIVREIVYRVLTGEEGMSSGCWSRSPTGTATSPACSGASTQTTPTTSM